jgi:hypothetical protein
MEFAVHSRLALALGKDRLMRKRVTTRMIVLSMALAEAMQRPYGLDLSDEANS